MTLPDYAVDFRGFPACPCLAAWLPVYERQLQLRRLLVGRLSIFQLIGDAPASKGIHAKGGAFDLMDLPGKLDLDVGREMGADAYWTRTPGQGFPLHNHGVLRGCPHNLPARYQIDAVDAGFNGLGLNGRGGPDDGPRPLSHRTWRQGLAWAREWEDNMPYLDWPQEDRAALAADVAKAVIAGAPRAVWDFVVQRKSTNPPRPERTAKQVLKSGGIVNPEVTP